MRAPHHRRHGSGMQARTQRRATTQTPIEYKAARATDKKYRAAAAYRELHIHILDATKENVVAGTRRQCRRPTGPTGGGGRGDGTPGGDGAGTPRWRKRPCGHSACQQRLQRGGVAIQRRRRAAQRVGSCNALPPATQPPRCRHLFHHVIDRRRHPPVTTERPVRPRLPCCHTCTRSRTRAVGRRRNSQGQRVAAASAAGKRCRCGRRWRAASNCIHARRREGVAATRPCSANAGAAAAVTGNGGGSGKGAPALPRPCHRWAGTGTLTATKRTAAPAACKPATGDA